MSRRLLLAVLAVLVAGAGAALALTGAGDEEGASRGARPPATTPSPTTSMPPAKPGAGTTPDAPSSTGAAPREQGAGAPAPGAETPRAPTTRDGLVIGIGDQNAPSLDAPAFRALGLRHARLVVPYDAMQVDFERDLVRGWLEAAARAGAEPFVTFGHSRVRPERLPSVAEFGRAVTRFRRAHPQVRTFAPWNEVNHVSQPTHDAPERAAAFHDALVDRCRGCTVVAGDLLDQAGMERYLARYRAALRRPARRWGLHNYSDTNRFRSSGTRAFLAAVDGEVWLTETGGVFRFGSGFPPDARRQARAVRYALRLAADQPRITRIYLYNWQGAEPGARFDAGLTDHRGRPRPALRALRSALRR